MTIKKQEYYKSKFREHFFNKQYKNAFEDFMAYHKEFKKYYKENKETFNTFEKILKNIDDYSEDYLSHKAKTAYCGGNDTLLDAYCILTLIKNPKNTEPLYLKAKANKEHFNYALNILDLGKRALNTDPKYASLYASLITSKIFEEKIEGKNKNKLKKYVKKYIKKSIELAPDAVEYTIQLARMYNHLEQNYKKALETYTKAIEIDPENSYFYSNRGGVKEKLNDTDGAIEDYKKCLEMDPFDYQMYWNLAALWRKKGQNEYATKHLEQAIKDNENNPNIQQEIYMVYEDHLEQINEIEKALEVNNLIKDKFPDLKDFANWHITKIYERLGKYEEIISICEAILAENRPDSEYVYATLSDAYLNLKIYDKALENAEKHIAAFPQYAVCYRTKGLVLTEMKKYTQAIKAHKKSLKHNECDPENDYFYIAITYERWEKLKKALEYYNKSLEINSTYFGTYFNIANILICLKKYDQALVNIKKALELNPTYPTSYLLLGLTYFKLKNYKLAFKNFDKTLELEPENQYLPHLRGACYYILGKYNEALSDLNKDIKLPEENKREEAKKYYLRAMTYEKLGNKTNAQLDYDKAFELEPKFNVKKFKKELFS